MNKYDILNTIHKYQNIHLYFTDVEGQLVQDISFWQRLIHRERRHQPKHKRKHHKHADLICRPLKTPGRIGRFVI